MNIMILKISIFLKIFLFFKRFSAESASILVFCLLIPLYSYVNFYQNDDWNRNSTILRFLAGDFSLLQVTATTFYTQGFLGFLWALLFTPSKIPFLTLLISVFNFYIFWKILQNLSFGTEFTRFLLSTLLLTNPIHAYSSIGFMTENYVIFYVLLGVFFYLKNEIYLSGFFGMMAFFSKQNALVFLVGFCVFFILSKKIKELKIFSFYTLNSLLIYYFIFPRTTEMRDKDFNFLNLTQFDYIFSLTYGIMIYLAFFTLPLLMYYIWFKLQKNNIKYLVTVIILTIFTFFSLNYFFKPGLISWEEFPYFENTFERTGFLPRTIDGTKYQFRFNYDFYYYADLVSKIALSFFLVIFISKFYKFKENINNFLNFNLTIMDINFLLMLFVSIFFDRYILLFLPFLILYFVQNIKYTSLLNIILLPFVIFQTYFSYFLSSDFIYSHNYIWTKSRLLVEANNVPENKIDGTGAWNRNYKMSNPEYVFSYDSPKVNKNYQNNYTLLETKDISFKGNLFINPKIYLYKKN